jgi:ABC-type amino acid transport substrate-binding protein
MAQIKIYPQPIGAIIMKKILLSLLLIILSFPAMAEEDKKESAFDRVIRTNTIRCGYYVFPPVTYRDPNTGELSGFTIDMMNEIGKRASLKIEWTEEYSWSGWTEALYAKRFDVACTPNWPDVPSGRVVAFGIPMFYAGIYPVVRSEDERFMSDDLSQLNREDITLAAPEGDALVTLTQAWFPKSILLIIPAGTDTGSYGLQITTKKADALLWDDNGLYQYNKTNEKKLKAISRNNPVKIQSFSMAVTRNDLVLKDFLDNAVHDLINDGTMDRLLRKWEPEPGKTYLRVANPAKVQ